MADDDLDTATDAANYDSGDDSVIGEPGPGVVEFDVEVGHPRFAGALTVYAADAAAAGDAVRAELARRYPGNEPDTAIILSCDPA